MAEENGTITINAVRVENGVTSAVVVQLLHRDDGAALVTILEVPTNAELLRHVIGVTTEFTFLQGRMTGILSYRAIEEAGLSFTRIQFNSEHDVETFSGWVENERKRLRPTNETEEGNELRLEKLAVDEASCGRRGRTIGNVKNLGVQILGLPNSTGFPTRSRFDYLFPAHRSTAERPPVTSRSFVEFFERTTQRQPRVHWRDFPPAYNYPRLPYGDRMIFLASDEIPPPSPFVPELPQRENPPPFVHMYEEDGNY